MNIHGSSIPEQKCALVQFQGRPWAFCRGANHVGRSSRWKVMSGVSTPCMRGSEAKYGSVPQRLRRPVTTISLREVQKSFETRELFYPCLLPLMIVALLHRNAHSHRQWSGVSRPSSSSASVFFMCSKAFMHTWLKCVNSDEYECAFGSVCPILKVQCIMCCH